MKVSEAKDKVCPFMTNIGQDQDGYFLAHKNIKCICGDCMAWQFTDCYESIPEVDEETETGYCKRLEQC